MGRTWTPEDDQAIRDGYANGTPVRALAKQLGCGIATISARADKIGARNTAGQQVAAAVTAKQLTAKERRAALKVNLLDDAARLREQLFAPTVVFNFGGKDNTYEERTLDQPPHADQLKIMQAVSTAIGSYDRLEKLDADAGTTEAVGMLDQIATAIGAAADALRQDTPQ